MAERAHPLGIAIERLKASDWEGAHAIVQEDPTKDGAWIHAHLHRIEGDEGNAAYWYRRAGREPATGSFDDERDQIEASLGGAASSDRRP